MSGSDQVRARIAGSEAGPMLAVFDTYRDVIRTVPVLQHDRLRLEDLDTAAEDHVADETRYACLARVMMPKIAPMPLTADGIWRRQWGNSRRERVLNWKML